MISYKSAVHDFGEQPQNTELGHVFPLVNKSGFPIRFLGIRSSCGCTWAANHDKLVGSLLSSKATLYFPVYLRTSDSMNLANGKIVIIYCLEKAMSTPVSAKSLTLELKATVLTDYVIDPLEIDFGIINGLELQKKTKLISVIPIQHKSLKILGVRSSTESLSSCQVVDTSNPHGEMEIEAQLDVSSFS